MNTSRTYACMNEVNWLLLITAKDISIDRFEIFFTTYKLVSLFINDNVDWLTCFCLQSEVSVLLITLLNPWYNRKPLKNLSMINYEQVIVIFLILQTIRLDTILEIKSFRETGIDICVTENIWFYKLPLKTLSRMDDEREINVVLNQAAI